MNNEKNRTDRKNSLMKLFVRNEVGTKGIAWVLFGLVLAVSILNLIIFCITIINSKDSLEVQYIPDDGFYYLTLARNFSSSGSWTFDSGISLTSGFHPLLAYLLAGTFGLFRPDSGTFVNDGVLIGLLFTLAAIVTLLYWGIKEKNLLFIGFLSLVFSSKNFVLNTISITEWSLVLFINSLFCVFYFLKLKRNNFKNIDFLFIFLLGALGSLARTDSGLLPFSIFIASALLFFFKMVDRSKVLLALSGLLGSVVGVLLGFANNIVFTNEIIQSSARMKSYWAEFTSPNYFGTPLLLGGIVGTFGLFLLIVLLGAAVLPRFTNKERDSEDHFNHEDFSTFGKRQLIMIIVSGVGCLIGYTLFYARSAGVRPWYTANLIVPLLMLILGLSIYISNILSQKVQLIVLPLFAVIVTMNVLTLYPINSSKAAWPHQQHMYEAGVFLRENPIEGRVGSWNAGIIGYFEGGHVINLDGLVNNNIYQFAVENDLQGYIESRHIQYIIDFDTMFESDIRRSRGGYDNADFLQSREPVMVFSDGTYGWSYLTLYRLSLPE